MKKGWFSRHALDRAGELNLTATEITTALDRSTKYELKAKEKMYKFSLYGMRSLDDFYLHDPKSGLLFTCNDREKGLVIITITKKG